MDHIGKHIVRAARGIRQTERGEMMRFFCQRLNPGRVEEGRPKITMSRMGKILEGIPTKDLYYLKRVCTDAKNFSKKFWFELDAAKHKDDDGPRKPFQKRLAS